MTAQKGASARAGGSKPMPRSARGIRTRTALIAAAREVFSRDGYIEARLSDISRAAEVASGSFYTYFNSKEEVFDAVLEEIQEEMLHPRLELTEHHHEIVARIEANNRAYLDSYQRNAKLMGVLEQVATIDDRYRALRLERGMAFAERNARSIRRLQEQGLADQELDPLIAARAISGMVSRLAYQVFVLGDTIPFETLVQTTTRLWTNALRIPERALAPAETPEDGRTDQG